MSLHHLANQMASQGRGPDDHLVHMSSGEVAGLQALAKAHGGTLTRNPQTGLPEAGFLSSILPTLIGAAGVYFGGIDPMTMGAIMGGGTALHTGDLGKGLMAGMSAYGGGSMAEGLGAAGAAAGTSAEAAKASTLLNGGTQEAAAANAADMAKANIGTGANAFMDNPSAAGLGGWKNIAMGLAPAAIDMMTPQKPQAPAGTQQMIRPHTYTANAQIPGQGNNQSKMIGATYTPGQDTSERMWFQPEYQAQTPYKAAAGGLMGDGAGTSPDGTDFDPSAGYASSDVQRFDFGGLAQLASQVSSQPPATGTDGHRFSYDPTSQSYTQTKDETPPPAEGGGFFGGAISDLVSQVMDKAGSQHKFSYDPAAQGYTKMAAGGGISTLGGYSDGGRLLKGPGDGMSDNIPASIGQKQPARLADGEFVVPADVVSHLGNGSTDAGAKQLYSMMNKVRKARTGNPKQGKQINADSFVPA